ncbi:uncharacterized protein LTR77_010314 [Saxophila tyrrhenica]|uniref:Protein kinase domain-containing protein n=1 Tax=Saxophila tyrrhenica TaxID=1690608 RepID=A0AAV9NW90_9PEZI|nr:hypothetical protein LTR77_010314 [Saxophila tyrrhenica]
MPYRFSFASPVNGQSDDERAQQQQEMGGAEGEPKRQRRSSLLRNIGGLWKRHLEQKDVEACPSTVAEAEQPVADLFARTRRSSLPETPPHRRAVPSLPRPQTFRRQESEKREKLLEVPPSPTERRAPMPTLASSAPDVSKLDEQVGPVSGGSETGEGDVANQRRYLPELPPLQIPPLDDFDAPYSYDGDEEEIDTALQDEYDQRWILNLSMQFRDKSNREKFFVTYAETPSNWRRLTISLDYRKAPEGSLEADLSTLHYQRDKSFRIYESIRESLAEIQYFPTVTNLKLETNPEDGQLHVHVREDANEIVQFPSIDLFGHVDVPRHRESDLEFISHLSGFVYKVRAGDKTVIKKEIPGPDNIDEFLYEVNALHALLDSPRVVDLEGLVTDESGLIVKGLLISYASQGALVDILYDYHNTSQLPWHRREKWAKQIVQGLSDIHEAGFVQGDFTLSNIVLDAADNAVIIDINRRGCPVGWEPPELGRLIDSGQRIGMCIGVKTDIYQLGMVLWALAEVVDEPERISRPLPTVLDSIPTYFRRMLESCLSERPQGRPSAKKLLHKFPASAGRAPSSGTRSVDFVVDDEEAVVHSTSTTNTTHRSDKEYIDPHLAVTLDDVNARTSRTSRRRQQVRDVSPFTTEQVTYLDPGVHDLVSSQPAESTTSYRFESSGSWVVGRRGRSPVSSRRRRSSPYARCGSISSSRTSLSRSPPRRGRRGGGSEVSEKEGELVPLPLGDKRVVALKGEVGSGGRELVHTDSGFDEQMDLEDVEQVGQGGVVLDGGEKELQQTVDEVVPSLEEKSSKPPGAGCDHEPLPPDAPATAAGEERQPRPTEPAAAAEEQITPPPPPPFEGLEELAKLLPSLLPEPAHPPAPYEEPDIDTKAPALASAPPINDRGESTPLPLPQPSLPQTPDTTPTLAITSTTLPEPQDALKRE